jgi:hypothetical protein
VSILPYPPAARKPIGIPAGAQAAGMSSELLLPAQRIRATSRRVEAEKTPGFGCDLRKGVRKWVETSTLHDMTQPYDSGYSGGPQQPWGTPGQQSPSGYSGQQSGYPQQGAQPQQGGYPPQQNGYGTGPASPQQGYAPQHQQQQSYPSQQGYGTPPSRHSAPSGRKGGSPAGIGIAIAGVLMAVGTFLPWI